MMSDQHRNDENTVKMHASFEHVRWSSRIRFMSSMHHSDAYYQYSNICNNVDQRTRLATRRCCDMNAKNTVKHSENRKISNDRNNMIQRHVHGVAYTYRL